MSTKFCDQCKHFIPAPNHDGLEALRYGRCRKGGAFKPDFYVSEKLSVDSLAYAATERGSLLDNRCGPKGLFYEALEGGAE